MIIDLPPYSPPPVASCVGGHSRLTLQVDEVAETIFAVIVATLRSAREADGLTQREVAAGLQVRDRAISEWECGGMRPKLPHLIQWCARLGHRLSLLSEHGIPLRSPLRQRAGEDWEHFERRRLAVPLRNRRVALGMSQTELGLLVGVSRDSIQRWELVRVPPRPMAHVVWAQKLGCTLVASPIRSRRWIAQQRAEQRVVR